MASDAAFISTSRRPIDMKLHLSILLAAVLPALVKAQYETYYEEECIVPDNDQADVEKDGTIFLTTTLTKTMKSTRTVFGKAPKTRLRVRTLTKTSKTLITLSPTSTTASSTFTTTCSSQTPSPSWTTSSGYTTATSSPSSGSSQPCNCPTSSTGGGVVPTSGTIAPTTGTGTGTSGTGTGTVGPTQTTGSTIIPTPTSSTPGCPCVTQTVTKTAAVKCRTVVIWNPVRTTCQAPSTTVTISI